MKYPNRTKIKEKIVSIIKGNFLDPKEFKKNSKLKPDNSIVTQVDLEVSKLIKEISKNELATGGITFFSEEEHDALYFPALILDPIDGTIELVKGIGECSLALAFMDSPSIDDEKNWGWIYNPFTGFEMLTGEFFYPQVEIARNKLLGLVSRAEFENNLFESCDKNSLEIVPRGSIAFKLGLLAAGACDFVVTKRPKSIWDIAAGTMLCRERGIRLYYGDIEVEEFREKRLDGPMIWCNPGNLDSIIKGLDY